MRKQSLIVGLFLCLASQAFADGIHPAYLEIEERENGNLTILWKVPLYKGKPVEIKPVFPPGFKLASPRTYMKTGSAIVGRWVISKLRIEGQKLSIDGLSATMTDVLVRIKLKSGRIHRVVLRPTETSTVVPMGTSESINNEKGFLNLVLSIIDRMRYAILLAVAFALSLLHRARERGILLCTTALLIGALCGHSINWISIPEKLISEGLQSKEDSSRILHGLLLNTYRAFIHQEEEAIYDRLAKSVSGDLLSDVYLQNSRAMRIDEASGQTMIVDRLDIKSIDSVKTLKDGEFSILTSWDVYGSVRHWKHVHDRCNTYKAWVSIMPTKTYWKIFDIQLIEEERII
jgi:hypothetical protein